MNGIGQAAPRNWFCIIAGAAGVVLGCLPFYVTSVPPMADLPAHVLVARIVLEHGDPVLRYSDFFGIQWAVAPTSLFYVSMLQLQEIFGPVLDARVYLTVWVIAIWSSVRYLARMLGDRDPWTAALAALPLAFCGYAYQGYLPFLMSMPLFALTVAVWLNDWKPAVKIASLWLLFAMLFGFHIVGAAAAAAVVSISAVTRSWQVKERRQELVWAFLSLAPLVLMTGWYLFGQQAPSAVIGYSGVLSQIFDVVKFTVATLSDGAAVLMALWIGALGILFVCHWWHWISTLPLLLGIASLGLLSVVMPGSLGSLWPAGPRLLPFVLLLMIAGMQWPERHRRPVAVACLLLLTGMSAFTTRQALELDRGYRDILAAAELVDHGKRVLPIMDRPEGSRWISPYLHAGDWVTVWRGGTNPYVLATPYVRTGAAPLAFRHDSDALRFSRPFDRAHDAIYYRGVGAAYDYVLLWGDSPAVAAIAEVIGQEMNKVYERGSARLFARATRPPP